MVDSSERGPPSADPEGALLLIFAKVPRPGRVKTRLVPPYSEEQAAAIYEACLDDVVERARSLGCPMELRFADQDESGAYFAQRYPDLGRAPQVTGDLGNRMGTAFDEAFAAGAQRVLVVGSDAPTLPTDHLRTGLDLLRTRDIAVGPARDGGYYGIGIRGTAWPRARHLFVDIPWSTDEVLSRTLARANETALDLALLPEWYDIDRVGDLTLARRDATGGRLLTLLAALERGA